MMKKSRLLIALLGTVLLSQVSAQKLANKVIYKWEQNGLIYYSHVKPVNVSNFTKLDEQGRKIEDFTEDFGEVVQIIVRPPSAGGNADGTTATEEMTDTEKQLAEDKAKDQKKENCEKAKKNLATLKTGEVYEKDNKGNLIRMSPEQIQTKLTETNKDIAYFCE